MIRVAIVEDTPDNRALLQVFLEEQYEVVEYEDGPSALEGMRVSRPEIVLLDISLPGMDGIEVLRAIRADAELQGIPVIAFTAHAMAGDQQQFLEQGFDDYVSKPILDDALLLDAIERQLARR